MTSSIPNAGFTPAPWKVGDCDSSIIWASGYRSVKWIECEPGPEAVEIATAPYPAWGRQKVLDALSLDDFDRRDEWEAECRANARLIAAAPTMHAALQVARNWFKGYISNGGLSGLEELIVIEAALKQAGGEQ